jgi:hypothetical protein
MEEDGATMVVTQVAMATMVVTQAAGGTLVATQEEATLAITPDTMQGRVGVMDSKIEEAKMDPIGLIKDQEEEAGLQREEADHKDHRK